MPARTLGLTLLTAIRIAYVIDRRDGRIINEVHTARRIPFVLTPSG